MKFGMLRTTGQSESEKKVEMGSSHNCTSESVSDYMIRVRGQNMREMFHFTYNIKD